MIRTNSLASRHDAMEAGEAGADYVAFGAIYRQVEDRQVRSCSDTRDDIAVAAESYRRLNGVYPDSIAPVADGIYLDDPELAERWTLTDESASGAPEYRLTGKGDCAKA